MLWWDSQSDYASFLPKMWDQIEEVAAIAQAVNPEIDNIKGELRRLVYNRFPQAADEEGIARWEKLLGVSSPLNSSLKARREAVLAKLRTKPPINLITLKEIIEAYMGVTVEIYLDGYTVKVRYRGESRIADLAPLYATAYETIPANLILEIAYAYVTWVEVLSKSWETAKQGSWDQLRRGDNNASGNR